MKVQDFFGPYKLKLLHMIYVEKCCMPGTHSMKTFGCDKALWAFKPNG